jgi:hypothetical protein
VGKERETKTLVTGGNIRSATKRLWVDRDRAKNEASWIYSLVTLRFMEQTEMQLIRMPSSSPSGGLSSLKDEMPGTACRLWRD